MRKRGNFTQIVHSNFLKKISLFRLHKAAIFVVVFFLLGSLFPFVQPANSAFTEKFNYQGKLYSITGGTVPDGNYDLVFKLYADPATTTFVWSSTSSSASLFTDAGTTVALNSATCGGASYDLITYTSNTNEATLQAGQTLWNTVRKESAIVKSNNTGTNQLCIYHPFSNWSNGEQVTNRIYVKSGLFSTMLGDFSSLSGVDFNQPLYLGVTVGTDAEMKPRRSIGTVPSALNSKTLNGLTWDNPGVIGSTTQSSAFFTQLAIGTTTFSGAMLNIKGAGSNALLNIMSSTSASVLHVSNAGNVGLGTLSPDSKFHIFNGTLSNTTTTNLLLLQGYNVDVGAEPQAVAIEFRTSDSNSLAFSSIRHAVVNDVDYGDNDESASNLIFSTTNGGIPSDKMIITGRGDIGIGTTSPSQLLTVGANNNFTVTSAGAVSANSLTLTTDLAVAHGGTGTSTTGANGSVIYSNGTAHVYTAAGTAGQILKSNGAGAPTWISTSTLGLALTDTTGILAVNRGGTGSTTLNTALVPELGANVYYTDARARGALSSTATGLTYTSGTGVLSLTSGYNIPLTASTTAWEGKVSSQWTTNGANIYYNGGNVSIGTTTNTVPLVIQGASSWGTTHVISSAANGESGIGFRSADEAISSSWVVGKNVGLTGDQFSIYGSGANRLVIDTNGNVGIGTSSPSQMLTVGNNNQFSVSSAGAATSTNLDIVGGGLNISAGNPVLAGNLTNLTGGVTLAQAYNVFVSGKYAYIPSYASDTLSIIDVSDSANPVKVGSIAHGEGGALLDGAIDVNVVGRYAYVASNVSDALEIIDVSDPTRPTHVGKIVHLDSGGNVALNGAYGVYVKGRYAYVAAGSSNAVEIVDISDPANPLHVSKIVHGTGGAVLATPYSISVAGQFAYVTSYGSSTLEIIDVSNVSNPQHAGLLAHNTNGAVLAGVRDLYVSGNYAYLTSYSSSTLEIVNISSSTNPTHVASLANGVGGALLNGAQNITVAGNYAYISAYSSDALEIVDISSSTNPVHAGRFTSNAILDGARGMFVAGNKAYLTSYIDYNFAIFDISGITAPAATIGNLASNYITVAENMDIFGNLSVRGGANISGGLAVHGDTSFHASSTYFAGYAGIGTTTPDANLYVLRGTGSDGNYAYPAGQWAGKVLNRIDSSTENGLVVANRWASAASTAFLVGGMFDNGNGFDTFFKVDGSGNIGIGTTSPSQMLTVGANNNFTVTSAGAVTANSLTLTTDLAVAHGGTGTSTTGANGSVIYSNGTAHVYTAAGTAGQILKSNGAGAPTWISTSTLGIALTNTTGTLAVNRGGTGATTLTGVVIANGTNAFVGSTTLSDSYITDGLTVAGGTIDDNNISSGATWTTLGTLTIGDNGDNIVMNANNWDVTSGGAATFAGMTVTNSLTLNPATAISIGLEHGYTGGTATTPYLDFHSGTTSVDYDSRIIASGGTGVVGAGKLNVTAGQFTVGTADNFAVSSAGFATTTGLYIAGALTVTGNTTLNALTASGLITLNGGLTIPSGETVNEGLYSTVYGSWGSSNSSATSSGQWSMIATTTLNGSWDDIKLQIEGGGRINGSPLEGNPFKIYIVARNNSTGVDAPLVYLDQLTSAVPSVKDVAVVHRSGSGTTNNVFEIWIQYGTNYQDTIPVKMTWIGVENVNFMATTPQISMASITAGYLTNYPVSYYNFFQGRFGVGTSTFNPLIALAVGDADTGLSSPSDGILDLMTNGAGRIRVDSSGNVGIGSTSPAAKLGVVGATYLNGTLTTSGTTSLASVLYVNQATGNVGIGTVNPDANLEVYGSSAILQLNNTSSGTTTIYKTMPGLELLTKDMNTSSKYGSAIKFMSTDSNFTSANPKFLAGILPRATETYALDTQGGMAIDFATTPNTPGTSSVPTVRMTIYNNGNVGIGNTAPSQLLTVGAGSEFTVSSAGFATSTGLYSSGALTVAGTSTFNSLAFFNEPIVEGNANYRVYHNLASYSSDASMATGTFAIETNISLTTNTMGSVDIDGYFYDATSPFKMTIGFYSRNTGFSYHGYINTGANKLPVFLATTSANKVVILVGTTTSVYPYPKISVTQFTQGYTAKNLISQAEGWTISQVTSTTAYTNLTAVADKTTIAGTMTGGTIGSNNISSGAVWTTLGSLTIGDGGDDVIINSADWDVTNAGAATFASVNSGILTITGTSSLAGLLYANTATGNVGIGTSTPNSSYRLHVAGSTYLNGTTYSSGSLYSAGDIYTNGSSDDLWLGNSTQSSANFRAYATGEVHIDADSIPLSFGEDQDADISYDGTNLVINPQVAGSGDTIFSAGKVGIGTSSPTAQLTVQGTSANALLSIRSANGQSALTINSVGMLSSNLVTSIASTSIYVKYSSSDFSQPGATVTVGMATGSDMIELNLASTTNIGNGAMSSGPTLSTNVYVGAHALQRPDGKFLIVHGNNANTTSLYDPVANNAIAGPVLSSNVQGGAYAFQRPDGKFLIVHGNSASTTTLYDPVLNTASAGPTLSATAWFGAHAFQRPDGKFLIVHGNTANTTTLYDPVANTTSAGPTLTANAYAGAHALQRPDGKFLIVHGNTANTTTLYSPVTNTTSAGPTLSANANAGAHALQRPDGKFLIVHGNSSNTTTIYDPVTNTTSAGPTLSANANDGAHALQRPDGKFLIVHGNNANTTTLYSPVTNTTSAGPTLSATSFAGAHALQRHDGKFLIIHAGISNSTTLYDPGYVTAGTYETEDIYSPNLNSSTLLNWQGNGEGNIKFEVKTATTQGGLSGATYATTTNGGMIRPVAGAKWVKIRISMSRTIPSNTANLNPYNETKTWLGESDTKYQRQFAMPKVYSLSLDNSSELKRFGADFGLTTSTSTSSSTPVLSNLIGGENGLSMPFGLELGISGTSSLGKVASGPILPTSVFYGGHSLQRPDGKFLIMNANNSNVTTVYDPVANTASTGPALSAAARWGAHAFQRPDGKFLIVHGGSINTTTIYDPVANTTSAGPILSAAASFGAHTLQRPDGKFLIVHGDNSITTTIYDPVANTTSAGPILSATASYGAHALQRPDGKFLVIHGDNTNTTNLYDPITNTMSVGPTLSALIYFGAHSLQRPDGKFLIVHGNNASTTTIYDPVANIASAGPTLSTTASYGAHTLQRPDGKFLIVHGFDTNTTTLYDPVTNTTSAGPTLTDNVYNNGHGIQRPDGTFLIVHGGGDNTTTIYDPGWITTGYYQSEFMNDSTLDSNSVLTWTGNADAFKNGIVNFSVRTATSSATLQGAAWRQIQRAGDLINPGAGETWIQVRINMNRPIPAQPGAGKNVWLGESGVTYNRLPLNPSAGYSNQAGVFVNPVISSFKVMNAGGSDLANFSLNGVSMFRFSASGDAYTRGSGAWNSGGADVAEYFPTDEYGLEPGDLVSITQAGEGLISKTSTAMDENVLGVITTKPGVKLGNDISEGLAGKQAVALVGRVPVKVSQENGIIIKGDKLTSSSQKGVAMKATEAGRVIGIALENYDPLQQTDGKILMFVNPHWYPGAVFMEKIDGQMSRWAWVVKKALAELSIDKTLEQVAVLSTGFTDMQFNIFDIYAQLASLRSEIDSIKNQLVQQPSEQIINPTPAETATTVATTASSSESMATSTASSSVEIIDLTTDESQALLVMQENTDSQTPNVEVMNVSSDGIVKVVGSLSIDGRSLTCAGACPPALSEAVDETRGDVGAEGKMVATTFENYCEDGFVWVAGSAKYGTMPGFCVMTDLAKAGQSNLPLLATTTANWTMISQGEAQAVCQGLGSNYHLLSENEWLTMTEQIVRNTKNDSDSTTAGLQLGVTATHYLANNQMVDNLAGAGMAEWTDMNIAKGGLPTFTIGTDVDSWQDYGSVEDYRGLDIMPPYYLNSTNNIGQILLGSGADNIRGFIRGFSGIYSLDLSNPPTATKADVGFRCAK